MQTITTTRTGAHFGGTGRIELDRSAAGGTVSSVASYDLDEFQEMIPVPDHDNPDDKLPGLKWMRGFLFGFVQGDTRFVLLPALGTTWTIHLEDGRRIKVIVEVVEDHRVVVRSTGGFF